MPVGRSNYCGLPALRSVERPAGRGNIALFEQATLHALDAFPTENDPKYCQKVSRMVHSAPTVRGHQYIVQVPQCTTSTRLQTFIVYTTDVPASHVDVIKIDPLHTG